MAAELRLFTDFYAALKELSGDLVGLQELAEQERRRYLELVRDTYELFDTAVLLVLNRLGELQRLAEQGRRDEFVSELRGLDRIQEWLDLEREVRMCANLRAAGGEMQSLTRYKGRIVIRNWDAFQELVHYILSEGESTLAFRIGESLRDLAEHADAAASSPAGYEQALAMIGSTSEALRQERRRFIADEQDVYSYIYGRLPES